MKRGLVLVSLSVLLILSLGIVSAGWFSDFFEKVSSKAEITGSAVANGWTAWYDGDDPSGSGDWELISSLQNAYPGQICDNPTQIECQTISGEDYTSAGQIATCSKTEGFYCQNSDNGDEQCFDYRVRFYCNTAAAECPAGSACPSLDSNNQSTAVVFNNYTYEVELISASDTAATIKVTQGGASETKEISELQTKVVQGLNVAVKSADETNLKLSATLQLSFVSGITEQCPAGYQCVSLDSNNSEEFVTFNNQDYYIVELISASDTTATIKVNNTFSGASETKEISELQTKVIGGLNVAVKSADETNLKMSAILWLSFVSGTTDECPVGSICPSLDSDNTKINVTFNNQLYGVELVSASDTTATIRIGAGGQGITKEVSEGTTKEINGLNVYVKNADETNLKLSAILWLSLAEITVCTDSDGGREYYTQGEVRGLREDNQITASRDYCTYPLGGKVVMNYSGYYLNEGFCQTDGQHFTIESHACPKGCVDGACRNSIEGGEAVFIPELAQEKISWKGMDYIIKRTTRCNIEVSYDEITEKFELPMLAQKTLKNGVIVINSWKGACDSVVLLIELEGDAKIISCKEGCLLDEKCYPYNNRNNGSFCSVSGEWLPQIVDNEACDNSFECESNVCISNQCVEGNLIQKILAWFRNLFG